MSPRPTLHGYIEDELLRAPMTIDLVVDAVLDQWRLRMPMRSRHDSDPVRTLTHHRAELVGTALDTLRRSAQAELRQLTGAPGAPADAGATLTRQGELALIDEDDVAVDIAIARCVEAIKLRAETDLRTLQTYTSALANDQNVSRDTNPFRPERFVRAFWAGVQALPLSRAVMAALLHEAAVPLAEGLQRTYQAAWHRLDDQAVMPATHRTIVAGGGTVMGGWGGTSARFRPPDGLDTVLGSLPASAVARPAPVLPPMPAGSTAAIAARLARPGAADHPPSPPPRQDPAEPHWVGLLVQLFDTIEHRFGLLPEAVDLLQRLQPVARNLVQRDPSLLDSHEHPMWRFMDRLVHDIQTSTPAQRLRLAGLGRNLVDHLARVDAPAVPDFGWALERLVAAHSHALGQAITAAAPAIERLQRRPAPADTSATTSSAVPLDIASLDTVPAALITEPAAARAGTALLGANGLAPGTLLRAYLQGEWRTLLALWQDDAHELALLRDPAADRLWALRQAALARLLAEGLAQPLRMRSLVRRAADRVLRGL